MRLRYTIQRTTDLVRAAQIYRSLRVHDGWTCEKLAKLQQERLSALVRHAVARSPFHRKRCGALVASDAIKLEHLAIMDKETMMENFAEIVTDPRLKLKNLRRHLQELTQDDYYLREYRVLSTSGSSGFPAVMVYERRAWSTVMACLLRWGSFADLKPSFPRRLKTSAVFADSPLHASRRLIDSADVGITRTQCLSGGGRLDTLVASLNRFQPDFLSGYPSMASLLAIEQLEGRLQIHPRLVSTGSEMRTEEMEQNIRQAWGAAPFNSYGLTEAVFTACDDTFHRGMHVFEDLVILEVVAENNRPVPKGTLGHKVLVTNLYNYAQPIIRYEVSDMVTMATEPCPCGRPYRMIAKIVGRNDDIIYLPGVDGGEVPVHAPDLRLTLCSLAAAIGVVLFIACINVANLWLARAENRNREFAIRAAVGATRTRLLRQLLIEGVTLAVLGAIAGLVIAWCALPLVSAHLSSELPRLRSIILDTWVFGFALVPAIGTGLIFGFLPAWRVSRMESMEMLRESGYGHTQGRERRLFQRGLIVAQVGLSLVLLFGAALMVQSVSRFLKVEPGYDPKSLLMFMVTHLNVEPAERDTKLGQLREAFQALPSVMSVAVSTHGYMTKVGSTDRNTTLEASHTLVKVKDADFFSTWRIPLKKGRAFRPDDAAAEDTVVINETLARTLWPGEDPVGQYFRRGEGAERCQVVGVVGDVVDSPEHKPDPHSYEPYERAKSMTMHSFFVLRTAAAPDALIPAIRKTLWELDRGTIPPEMMLLENSFRAMVRPRETFMQFLGFFALVGLALAAIGIYGVLSHLVARRTREIGVRMALGANKRKVLALVLGQGARLIAMGVFVGSLGAFVATRFIQNKLFGVSSTDPATFVAITLLLFAVALLACYLPARRATKVDPMVALRHE